MIASAHEFDWASKPSKVADQIFARRKHWEAFLSLNANNIGSAITTTPQNLAMLIHINLISDAGGR